MTNPEPLRPPYVAALLDRIVEENFGRDVQLAHQFNFAKRGAVEGGDSLLEQNVQDAWRRIGLYRIGHASLFVTGKKEIDQQPRPGAQAGLMQQVERLFGSAARGLGNRLDNPGVAFERPHPT